MRVGADEPRGDRHAAGTWPVTLADIKGSSEREMISSLTFMSGNTGRLKACCGAATTTTVEKAKHSRPQGEKMQRQLIVSEAVRIISGSFSSVQLSLSWRALGLEQRGGIKEERSGRSLDVFFVLSPPFLKFSHQVANK